MRKESARHTGILTTNDVEETVHSRGREAKRERRGIYE